MLVLASHGGFDAVKRCRGGWGIFFGNSGAFPLSSRWSVENVVVGRGNGVAQRPMFMVHGTSSVASLWELNTRKYSKRPNPARSCSGDNLACFESDCPVG